MEPKHHALPLFSYSLGENCYQDRYVRRSKHLIIDDLAYRSSHALIDISCGW